MDAWLAAALLHLAGMALFSGWLVWRSANAERQRRPDAPPADLDAELMALYAQYLLAPRLAREEALRSLRSHGASPRDDADFFELVRQLQRARRHLRTALR